jgi:hypothetical protein
MEGRGATERLLADGWTAFDLQVADKADLAAEQKYVQHVEAIYEKTEELRVRCTGIETSRSACAQSASRRCGHSELDTL